MGLYDRDYYREEPRGAFAGGQWSMVTILIVANVAIFLADIAVEGKLSGMLSLKADALYKPWELWQLLTCGFAHDDGSIWHVAMNMFILWLFGRDIENIYGRKEFLLFFLSTIVMASLAWLLSQAVFFPHELANSPRDKPPSVVGASGGCMGVAVMYAFHFPKRMLYIWGVLPIPAWAVIGYYVFKDIIGMGGSIQAADAGVRVSNVAFAGHLGGAACGLLFYKTRWHLGRLLGVFGGLFSGNPLRRRPRLRVHRDEQEAGDLSGKVDAILQKISREGEQSLSAKERRILEDASRRYQRRNR